MFVYEYKSKAYFNKVVGRMQFYQKLSGPCKQKG